MADRGGDWRIVRTREFDSWFRGLQPDQANKVTAAMRRVSRDGPTLGRPRVDSLHGSRIHNLKELRVRNMRVLFVFGRRREAVMLLGGDKTATGNRWYRHAIPKAERVYADHQRRHGRGDDWNRGTDRGGRGR